MMIWIVLAILLGAVCAMTQFWTVRLLQPEAAGKSQLRLLSGYFLRMGLIGLYLWQLVQQGLVMILIGLGTFFLVYIGGVFYVAMKKPEWLHKKAVRTEQWMQ